MKVRTVKEVERSNKERARDVEEKEGDRRKLKRREIERKEGTKGRKEDGKGLLFFF